MYFGRGDDDDIFSLHEHLKTVSPTREDLIRNVSGKIPALSSYLSNAIKKAEELGINIEEDFE